MTIQIIGLAALSLYLLMSAGAAENAFLPPTATEIFHLRSECAALGKKILDENCGTSPVSSTNLQIQSADKQMLRRTQRAVWRYYKAVQAYQHHLV
jgi:hypothetical protein